MRLPPVCPSCGAFATLRLGGVPPRIVVPPAPQPGAATIELEDPPRDWKDHLTQGNKRRRYALGLEAFNEVVDGGLVADQAVLLAGEPGAGKSTLVLQLIVKDLRTLYVSSEESAAQVAERAERISPSAVFSLAANTNAQAIVAMVEKADPELVIVDSVNQLVCPGIAGAAGTAGQVRAATRLLLQACKARERRLIVLGQVNKDGELAGPKQLEHMVDTVIELGLSDGNPEDRLLRSGKNRFGQSGLSAWLTMSAAGLSPGRHKKEAAAQG